MLSFDLMHIVNNIDQVSTVHPESRQPTSFLSRQLTINIDIRKECAESSTEERGGPSPCGLSVVTFRKLMCDGSRYFGEIKQ